ncbi:MAG: hypothetical protein A2469_04085 [Candidatus Magasanikbacteria bacterium RIFOXYC2_FULL_40_16]|uniref:UPF0102 protein A2373_00685 n=2 Tax=Candidatus Magasanikiibacteriota TaxID=1752731 RepID=A0A1F6NJC4_9BACT|nr:MAG: hypothetical protein A2373_00685 [Candidatus Magasanikbacteria bacterium RIFOXYB1_FULL_40_15]OGH89391.1 MAG: hypothetical protein A2469_04085 [Candidatus Magasanikbacteria bacterium RIFOXYC2_FULL_40_16]
MKTEKRKTGDRGEDIASSFLIKNKYKIIARNFNTRGGEIDIIAQCKTGKIKTLCFVEVKTRQNDDGSAERATGAGKLSRLFSAARAYCLDNNIDMENTPIQFEQVSVYLNEKTGQPECAHFVIPVD